MAGVNKMSKTNSFGTFLETIEKRQAPAAAPPAPAPPAEAIPVPAPESEMTEASRRVLRLLATGQASVTQLRAQADLADDDGVLDDLVGHGFIERSPGRSGRYALTPQGRAVVQLLSA